ncbi:MAG TPA: alpha-L-fucosidase [Verrucomicrobiae bacterium]|nr:alpha-L-fucosidase [Verrucomicrobiae bacterium]
MLRWLVSFLICASAFNAPGGDSKQLQEEYPGYRGVDPDYQHAGQEAIDRWSDWKLGLRIHWGVYSMLGVEASWALKGASPEFDNIYDTLYQDFDPIGFNADEWTDIMQRGGIKYFTITGMHADGFCLWPTERTLLGKRRPVGSGAHRPKGLGPVEDAQIHYSIAETPYRKDILAQLVASARKKDIGIGFYFSLENWLDPDFAWHDFDASNTRYDHPKFDKASDPARWQRFIDKTRLELKELASNYGSIDDLSFDCSWPTEAFSNLVEIVKMVRGLQPHVMMRNRGIQQYGDYGTPEMNIPPDSDPMAAKKTPGAENRIMPWQVIYHIGEAWSYLPADRYQSKEWILSTFIDVVAKGGNMEIGFGPPASGRWQPEMIDRLDYLGDWLAVNGEAIYKTRPWQRWNEGKNIRFTRSKDGKYIYAISLRWPGEKFFLHDVRPTEGSSIFMLGYDKPLQWNMGPEGLTISIPAELSSNRPCRQAYAFRMEGAFNSSAVK